MGCACMMLLLHLLGLAGFFSKVGHPLLCVDRTWTVGYLIPQALSKCELESSQALVAGSGIAVVVAHTAAIGHFLGCHGREKLGKDGDWGGRSDLHLFDMP